MTAPVVWFYRFPTGRFANAAFQLLAARAIERALGCRVVMGASSPRAEDPVWRWFDLPDPLPLQDSLPPLAEVPTLKLSRDRAAGPEPDLLKLQDALRTAPLDVVAVDGYFQYDTGCMGRHDAFRAAFADLFSVVTEPPRTTFQKRLSALRAHAQEGIGKKYLVAIHVRRGDYLRLERSDNWAQHVFYTLDLDAVVDQLRVFLDVNRVPDPIIYVATDDPDYCQNFFAQRNLKILTADAIFDGVAAALEEPLLADLAVVSLARVFVASNSSLSCLMGLLNDRATAFWRQLKGGRIVAYDPWATPVLFGLTRGV